MLESKMWFMFPEFHNDIAKAVSNDSVSPWFNEKGRDHDANNTYSTHIMGRFICKNGKCSNGGWLSKKIAIVIRGYPGNGYNAIVYNQRCDKCNCLGTLILDKKSYIDRIVYRLKKWAGIWTEPPPYTEKEGKPHKQDLCEGCKRGHCQGTSYWED